MSSHKIVRLDEKTIHQIAAGEVVQSPSAALKEMLENCLDAGATKIQVIGDDGGLALLQLTDNGHGIAKEDFPLICTRFATSKLQTIDDLKTLETFGFRGEALAAISYCARVRITSRHKESTEPNIAYTANFLDGKMIESEPVPCAAAGFGAAGGTTIQVEQLFYNAPLRRQAYGKTQDEWNRIVDVVSKYALQNHLVGFSCSKQGAVRMDLALAPNSTFQGVVSAVKFGGSQVSSHLKVLEDKHLEKLEEAKNMMLTMMMPLSENNNNENVLTSFKFSGYFSDLSFCGMTRKTTLVVFVNGRLVESGAVKRILDMAYAPYLVGSAKGWWVFISIHAKPDTVDVNVHPTKHEVMMLHEPTIISAIYDSVKKGLQANLNAQNTVTTAPSNNSAKQKLDQQVVSSASNVRMLMTGNNNNNNNNTNKSIASSSMIIPTLAPCFVARVNEQRGSMASFLASVTEKKQKEKEEEERKNKKNARKEEQKVDDDDDEAQFVGERPRVIVLDEKQNSKSASPGRRDREEEEEEVGQNQNDEKRQQHQQKNVPVSSSIFENILAGVFDNSSSNSSSSSSDGDDDNKDEDESFREFNKKEDEFARRLAEDDDGKEKQKPEEDPNDSMMFFRNFQKQRQMEEEREENERIQKEERQRLEEEEEEEEEMLKEQQQQQPEEELASVYSLRESFKQRASRHYATLLRRAALVGSIDAQRALIQCDTSLLLLDVPGTIFYLTEQRVFAESMWSKFPRWALSSPTGEIKLFDAILKTLKLPCFKDVVGLSSVKTVATKVCAKLTNWRDMLDEYFGISILSRTNAALNENETNTMMMMIMMQEDEAQKQQQQESSEYDVVVSVPAIFGQGLEVSSDLIGPFLLRIATETNFEGEESCFRGIARELSFLYSACGARVSDPEALLRDVVIPALRGTLSMGMEITTSATFYAPDEMAQKFVVQPLVSTEQLYRVFERC